MYLILLLCKDSVCEPNPCRNGGQCTQEGNDFDCQCPEGFSGRFCHVGKYCTLISVSLFSKTNVCAQNPVVFYVSLTLTHFIVLSLQFQDVFLKIIKKDGLHLF